ncbi:hypothetical protein [Streptomyces sp. H39-S7]|uniref:hypothetical protein n=1 Tax=Streptomyces sp. H39-S7 TaxID=3004357 RepID=UPI002F354CAB
MQRLLATRGLDPNRLEAEGPGEGSDGQPAALELAERRIPPRYRQATADHPEVATWVRHVTLAARPGPGGAPGIATGPSLLIAGPTVINGA